MSNMVNLRTLVLTSDYMPLSFWPLYTIPAQDAIARHLNGNCDIVFSYDRRILTPSRNDLYWPSVIANHNTKKFKNEVRLRKNTLFYREDGICFYCTKPITTNNMTYDHYIPRKHGGGHDWDNVVACCEDCNTKKGDKLPEGQWKGTRYIPYKPSFFQLMNMRAKHPIFIDDPRWANFLPGFTYDNIYVMERGKPTLSLSQYNENMEKIEEEMLLDMEKSA